MKLSRNKIQKIRKQQHQSVRKWKKHHKSARRSTFRQSRRQNMTGIITKYPSKLNNVLNRTLKKYIPLPELAQIKENYKKIRRMRRKQKHYKMTGGVGSETGMSQKEMMETVVAAAVGASVRAILANENKSSTSDTTPKPITTNNNNNNNKPTTSSSETAASAPGPSGIDGLGTDAPGESHNAVKEGQAESTETKKTGKNAPFSLRPEVKGDISLRSETHVCQTEAEVYKLVEFLIQKGLPYYIQIDMDPGNKPTLSKNDTDLFDLRRILYGKFAKDIKNIREEKRKLYFEEKAVVGIANGDTLGNEYPDSLFIYTGEKGQIQKGSSDTAIKVQIIQKDNNRPSNTVLNSNRLYKLGGKDTAASIDTVALLQKLESKNNIDTSELRLQVAPLTEDEFKKDAEKVASGSEQGKNVTDESNMYVVNLKVGCKITSVQTLRKSLERVRASLENDEDTSKTNAMDTIKMLNELLQDPEFMKNEGYDDFKEQVYGFSYKIRGSERKYGFTQMQTFFNDKKDDLPSNLSKEFFKLLNWLGHGSGGVNGDCLAFEGPHISVWEMRRLESEEKDGKIVTKITDKLDSASNVSGFAKQLSKLGQINTENEDDTKENASSQSGSSESASEGSGASST
jgi:hypothetical protein